MTLNRKRIDLLGTHYTTRHVMQAAQFLAGRRHSAAAEELAEAAGDEGQGVAPAEVEGGRGEGHDDDDAGGDV